MFFFLEFSCFFHDPADVGNLISGSSAFSKTSLNIWKFTVHVLLKPGLENFKHYFTSVWDWVQLHGSLSILWHCLCCGLEWKLTFSNPVATSVFQICWHIECSTLTASSFRIWNSSTGIPSPPLALFILMLPKAHLTSHSRMSGSRGVKYMFREMRAQECLGWWWEIRFTELNKIAIYTGCIATDWQGLFFNFK